MKPQQETEQRSLNSRPRVSALDGLRGIAIFLVFGIHLLSGTADNHGNPVVGYVVQFLRCGWIGVDLFFVLSGFLITGILLHAKENGAPIRTFFFRRALRIFPAYYFALFVLCILAGFGIISNKEIWQNIGPNIWYFLTYTNNFPILWRGNNFPGVSHFWTLAIEEQFYLIWPFIVYWLSRNSLLKVVCIVPLLIFAWRAMVGFCFPDNAVIFGASYVMMPLRADSLLLGALVAILGHYRYEAQLRKYAVFGLCVFGVLVALLVLDNGLLQTSYLLVWSVNSIAFSGVIAAFSAGMLPGLLVRALSFAPLCWIGFYSYGIYIWHDMLPHFVGSELVSSESGGPSRMTRLIFTLMVLPVAVFISWNLIEKPALALRDYMCGLPRNAALTPVARLAKRCAHIFRRFSLPRLKKGGDSRPDLLDGK
jgi:peptidoglycan/LPS O-acetylase OafA/YrhL